MSQFALICLPDFLKSSSNRKFFHARHFNETCNKLKNPKNIATTMARLSQKASSRFPSFYKNSLVFFSVLCIRICGAALSNYLDAISLRFVRHHSMRRHICLHALPFHTPADAYFGQNRETLTKRDQIKRKTLASRSK
jgi:hypothetical protein